MSSNYSFDPSILLASRDSSSEGVFSPLLPSAGGRRGSTTARTSKGRDDGSSDAPLHDTSYSYFIVDDDDYGGGGGSVDNGAAFQTVLEGSTDSFREVSTREGGAAHTRNGWSTTREDDNDTVNLSFLVGSFDDALLPSSRTSRILRSRQAANTKANNNSGGGGTPPLAFLEDDHYELAFSVEGASGGGTKKPPPPPSSQSTSSTRGRQDLADYETEMLHIISTYAGGREEEEEAAAAARAGKQPHQRPASAKAKKPSFGTGVAQPQGPQPWPMPPKNHQSRRTTVERHSPLLTVTGAQKHSRANDDSSRDVDGNLAYLLEDAPDAEKALTASTDKAWEDHGRTSPKESRFSPELVALTVSGANLTQVRRIAQELDINLPTPASTPISVSGRTLKPLDNDGSAYGENVTHRDTDGDGSSPVSGAAPVSSYRRWSDGALNLTKSKPKAQVSPPPRTPQTPTGVVNTGSARAANSLPPATVAPRGGEKGGQEDLGAGGTRRRYSEPAHTFARSPFDVGKPSSNAGWQTTSNAKPRSPRTVAFVTTPFPAEPPEATSAAALPGKSSDQRNRRSDGNEGRPDRAAHGGGSSSSSRTHTASSSGSNVNGASEAAPAPAAHRGRLTTTTGRIPRPKPTAPRQKPPAPFPSLHTDASEDARKATGDTADSGKPPPALTPLTTSASASRTNGKVDSQGPAAPAPAVSSSSHHDDRNAKEGAATHAKTTPPRKVSTLPAIAARKPTATTTASTTSSSSPAAAAAGGAGRRNAAGNGATVSQRSGELSNGGVSRGPRSGAASALAASLLPPPPTRTGILEKRPIYVRGGSPAARRRHPPRRHLPNGRRRANWKAPETHYLSCLSMALPYDDDDDDDDDDGSDEGAKTSRKPFSSASSTSSSTSGQAQRVRGGAASSLRTGGTSGGRPTPLGDAGTPPTGGLLVDEVEKLRKRQRLKGQYNDESPLSSSLTPVNSPFAKVPTREGSVSPLDIDIGGTNRVHPANVPLSQNQESSNNSIERGGLATYTFLHVSLKKGPRWEAPSSEDHRGGSHGNRQGSATAAGRSSGVVTFSEDTIFFEPYDDDYDDDELEEEEAEPELDSSEFGIVDAQGIVLRRNPCLVD